MSRVHLGTIRPAVRLLDDRIFREIILDYGDCIVIEVDSTFPAAKYNALGGKPCSPPDLFGKFNYIVPIELCTGGWYVAPHRIAQEIAAARHYGCH